MAYSHKEENKSMGILSTSLHLSISVFFFCLPNAVVHSNFIFRVFH